VSRSTWPPMTSRSRSSCPGSNPLMRTQTARCRRTHRR
jgi:hypothetical protein